MVNWHWRLGWLISLLWLPVAAAEPDTAPPASLAELSYLTEQYKPYNYQAAGELPAGLAVELLHRIWRQTGTAEQPIQVLPWPRAYNQLNVQPDTVLFSTARTKEREPLFKWACPIARSPIVLIALKESRIRLSSLKDASRYRIAAILDDVGHQLLLSQQVDPEAIHTTRTLLPALRQLPMHRTDLIASNGPVAWQQLQEMGVDLSRYEEVWTLGNEEFCYAFNRQIDDARVQQFQQALDRVRQQADYPALLQRFGLAP